MCGLCNLFGFGRRSGCGYSREAERETCCRRTEPRMNTYCASGYGSESSVPCGYEHDYDSYDNDCSSCQRRRSGCDCD